MAKSAASKTQPTTDLPSLFGSEDPLFSSTLVAGVDEAAAARSRPRLRGGRDS